jgi:hypothetical protein
VRPERPIRPENALPPGNSASVWAEEGYAEAAHRLEERIGLMVDGGVAVDVAEREAPPMVRAWWRGLTQEQRRKLRG